MPEPNGWKKMSVVATVFVAIGATLIWLMDQGDRLTTAEANYENLEDRVGRLEKRMDIQYSHIRSSLNRLEDKFDRLRSELRSAPR